MLFLQTMYNVFTSRVSPLYGTQHRDTLTHGFRVRKERDIMLGAHEQRSEVARLLSQISAEYEAAHRGLAGLAYGMSQHDFITARMENMGQLHTQLQSIVGDVAIAMIADCLNTVHS